MIMTVQKRAPEAAVTMARYECAPGIYEIDEFDCASAFLVTGDEKALLIDTGIGIGDLKWFVEDFLGDMTYEVIATHNHGDHIGGAGWFERIWIHPADGNWKEGPAVPTLDFRKEYARMIRGRSSRVYLYDPDKDIRPWPGEPVFQALTDHQTFDLGGRLVTVYHCPGHTPGEIVLADSQTKTLLCGDACNCNWLLSSELGKTPLDCAEKALRALQQVTELQGTAFAADKVINSHHDFRNPGQPLAPETMPNLIACLKSIVERNAHYEKVPDPLSTSGALKTVARYGNVMVSCV